MDDIVSTPILLDQLLVRIVLLYQLLHIRVLGACITVVLHSGVMRHLIPIIDILLILDLILVAQALFAPLHVGRLVHVHRLGRVLDRAMALLSSTLGHNYAPGG